MLPKLIVIEGTNASGKSSLGVELAARFGGEIISADSRQVFRRLDLGSGKITPEGLEALDPYRVRRAVFIAAGFGSRPSYYAFKAKFQGNGRIQE